MTATEQSMKTVDVCTAIRAALRQRSGTRWSVTHGRGTAYGWITINAPNARRTWRWASDEPEDRREVNDAEYGRGHIGPDDRAELAKLLGLDSVHHQGVSIAAGHDYYREYLARARGETPEKIAEPYWD